ncbi:FTH domain-containing protein [Caenorhabditis elegans]|uniref:FTH domain-containing protein n=1 Tax=Caenorhabditis elegans TaxID=6239 RepID=Q94047_CAEEL|nr:FTH domain-containing protein [Caenorhabditis elegans]CAB03355.2 FTH domain-containing protein [Caenorhabditis elegans]|eukprot:NP_501747.2 Uncharacterized protein CELE_T13F2.4 [Caenorhabditis elegans]
MMCVQKVEKISNNSKIKKTTKRDAKPKKPKMWRVIAQKLVETIAHEMKISEIMDLSIMAETISNGCNERIKKHFKNLQFRYLNTLEIEVNGEKMTVFNIISFIEYLGTYNICINYAEFKNFPTDGVLRKALFEAVQRISKKTILFQIFDDTISFDEISLIALFKESSSVAPVVLKDYLKERVPVNAKYIELHLNSLETSVLPKFFRKKLMELINPRKMEIYFNINNEIPPTFQTSSFDDTYLFQRDNIKEIINDNLQFLNFYFNCSKASGIQNFYFKLHNIEISYFL